MSVLLQLPIGKKNGSGLSLLSVLWNSLPDYDADCKEIEDRLDRGEYVGHHSKVFEESYSSHYRIISRQIFEKELRPLL